MDTIQKSENNSPQIPLPAPELDRLNVFVGSWHSEGYSYNHLSDDTPHASAQKWISDESYEWMPDKYFLVHRWDATVGGHNFKRLEIIGYDVARKEYFTRMFDNGGNAIKYRVTVEDDTWKFTEPFTRTTVVFSDGGNVMTFKCEWRQERGNWLPLSNRKAVKNN